MILMIIYMILMIISFTATSTYYKLYTCLQPKAQFKVSGYTKLEKDKVSAMHTLMYSMCQAKH